MAMDNEAFNSLRTELCTKGKEYPNTYLLRLQDMQLKLECGSDIVSPIQLTDLATELAGTFNEQLENGTSDDNYCLRVCLDMISNHAPENDLRREQAKGILAALESGVHIPLLQLRA
jgi:hypothetical protein